VEFLDHERAEKEQAAAHAESLRHGITSKP